MGRVYELHVALTGVEPSVWRSLRVPADLTLEALHRVLQAAMGWQHKHTYSFRPGRQEFGRIVPAGPRVEDGLRLDELLARGEGGFLYAYDPGDGWSHEVSVDKEYVDPAYDGSPACLIGGRACPPEDCGGPGGYYELLDALSSPDHPDHRRLRKWAGPRFNPELFDLAAANERLSALKPRRADIEDRLRRHSGSLH